LGANKSPGKGERKEGDNIRKKKKKEKKRNPNNSKGKTSLRGKNQKHLGKDRG